MISCTKTQCTGCFPLYQPNQLAHMEPGGCLWYEDTVDDDDEKSNELKDLFVVSDLHPPDQFDSFIESLFEEETKSLVVEGGLDSLFSDEISQEDQDSTETECCICYESIDKTKNNCTTECGHTFCLKCLMTSMMHDNFACPCCRADLVDLPDEDISDDEEEYDSDEDENEDDNETECNIEELTRRITSHGFSLQDVLSILMSRYAKGASELDICELNKKFDDIVNDADDEAVEMEEMGKEDSRTIASLVV